MIGEKLRRLLFGDLYERAKRAGRVQSAKGSKVLAAQLSRYMEILERAEEELSGVIVPGYDYDLMSSGAVKKLKLSYDMETLYVLIDYTGSDPGCNFCRFINWQVWKKILEDAEKRLLGLGVKRVVFIDWATGAVIDYRREDRPEAA